MHHVQNHLVVDPEAAGGVRIGDECEHDLIFATVIDTQQQLDARARTGGAILELPKAPDFSKVTVPEAEDITYNGEDMLFATGIIKLKKWVLVIKEDPTDQLAPLLRARFMMVLVFLGGVILIIIGAVFTTRSMMKELMIMDQKKAASDELMMQESKMAALGKMAAGIAHEINNPLAVIGEKAGWIKDLLKMEDISASENFQEYADAVNKIEHHINRAKTITHRLLGFARRMEPVTERVNINSVLDESVAFLENEARYRNIDIQVDYAAELPLITSDSSQLQQVFLNILNNAIDAIGKEGEINIRTKHVTKNNEIRIEINDNGPGIPKDLVNKIFDPFFTTKPDGMGLGLSISRTISANDSVVSARYGPDSRSTMRPSTRPIRPGTTTDIGRPTHSGTFQ